MTSPEELARQQELIRKIREADDRQREAARKANEKK